MSWRASSGRDVCLTCRVTVDLGAPLYVGEHTPTTFCESCALAELGKTPDGAEAVPEATGLDRVTRDGLRTLLFKHAPTVARTWGERE